MTDDNTLYDFKITWIPTQILDDLIQNKYLDDVECPYCFKTNRQVFSNGDVFDVTSNGCELKCPDCEEMFYLSWEGEPL